jgi:hypothetical protein
VTSRQSRRIGGKGRVTGEAQVSSPHIEELIQEDTRATGVLKVGSDLTRPNALVTIDRWNNQPALIAIFNAIMGRF